MIKPGWIGMRDEREGSEWRQIAPSFHGNYGAFWEDNWAIGEPMGIAGTILLPSNKELCRVKVPRPMGAIAASDGSFFVLDIIDIEGPTRARILRFSSQGVLQWEFLLPAWIDCVALSVREDRILLSTQQSRYYFLDAQNGAILWERFIQPVGRHMVPGFQDGQPALFIVDLSGARLSPIRFGLAGETGSEYTACLAESNRQAEIARIQANERDVLAGKYYAILPLIEGAMKAESRNWDAIKGLLNLVVDTPGEVPEYARAKIWRYKGEVNVAEGHLEAGLGCWDYALGLDPKVGIKKKAETLRSKLASQRQAAGGN